MNRTDRLMGIVAFLQSRKYADVEQMAARFGISVRTVFRDLKALGEIGVPIGFEPGKGYFIVNGYFLPPVSLSMEEANALALMEPIVQRFADRSIQEHFETALSKIKMVLSRQQREQLEQTQAQTAHFLPEVFQHLMPGTYYLSDIQQSINQKTILHICYGDATGAETVRDIEPIGLIFYSLNWHIIAWCHLRGDYRDFRVSRIATLKAGRLPFRKKDHVELMEFMRRMERALEPYLP